MSECLRIYFVNNNLVFWTLSLLDTTTFQILSQLKIIFTALLFRMFISRKLTSQQPLGEKSGSRALWLGSVGSVTR